MRRREYDANQLRLVKPRSLPAPSLQVGDAVRAWPTGPVMDVVGIDPKLLPQDPDAGPDVSVKWWDEGGLRVTTYRAVCLTKVPS